MTTSVEVRGRLVEVLRRDLIGPSPDDTDIARERLGEEPSRWYLSGYIAPAAVVSEDEAAEESDDPEGLEIDEDDENDRIEKAGAAGAAPDRVEDDKPIRRRSFHPSAIGITVLLPQGVRDVEAIVTWGDYQTEPSIEAYLLAAEGGAQDGPKPDAPRVEWVRIPRSENLRVPVPSGRADRPVIVPNSGTPQLPGGSLELTAHARDYEVEMPDGSTNRFQALTVFLVNRRKKAPRRYEDIAFAFQAQIELRCPEGFVPRVDLSGIGAEEWDRRVADLHYSDMSEYAVGRNTSAVWEEVEGRCTVVSTCPLPMAEVERVAPQEDSKLPGVEFAMEKLGALAAQDGQALASALSPLPDLYASWIAAQSAGFHDRADRRKQTAQELLANMETARGRIARGIEILRDASDARLAFRFMNESLARAARRRSPKRYQDATPPRDPKWRPFQLAFILLNLEGLVGKTHPDREIVDLLFFPTGGGKTEAYLGLAAFTIAHRRITHQGLTGAGVAIVMRYTLRLLTLDQLGRAAGVICALELARLDPANVDAEGRKLLGDWPIEIGLWVGNSATPNKMGGVNDTGEHTAVTRVRKHQQDPRRNPAPVPIKSCPWCDKPFQPSSFSCVPANNPKPKNLEIRCSDPDCDFTGDRALPIIVVDEVIYRRLPAFVVATVDKFAALPWVGETGAFFDHVDRCDAHGFYGAAQLAGSKIPGGEKLLPPDLIIQDELHLISGPLGTVAGLYETAIDRLATRWIGEQRVRAKIVASTATVRRASAQIKSLFDREETQIFPPPGLSRRDSFFAVTVPSDQNPARLYLGVASQGRGPKLIFLRTLLSIMAAAKAEYERASPAEKGAVDPYMTALCYFNALKELGGAKRIVDDEVTSGLKTYGRRRRRIGPPDAPFGDRTILAPLELTSRVSTDKVAEAKSTLERSFGADGPIVDLALATNMISVGLDIERLGLMIVQGQPKAAAEYIQATSRVGRDHNRPGLVITVLNVMKPRDRTHFEHFTQFHRTFYRAVEATSVTPWAQRALDRSLASIVVSLARHLDPKMTPESGAGRVEARRAVIDAVTKTLLERAGNAPAGGTLALKNAITELVNAWMDTARSIGVDELTYSDNHQLLNNPLDPRLQTLSPEHQKFESARSMRDVEPNVELKLRDPYGNPLQDRGN
jgi:hypothetical protein